jgi:hypothetical protein
MSTSGLPVNLISNKRKKSAAAVTAKTLLAEYFMNDLT